MWVVRIMRMIRQWVFNEYFFKVIFFIKYGYLQEKEWLSVGFKIRIRIRV